ncbi:MAG: hypothetical protein HON70_21530, partial [Lentisphaerae bacterium]|nr:hypothetical protein [Lentisphaerota bacterium]
MSDQQTSEAPDARSLLDEHLDAVERVLQETGVSRSERQSICEEVEGQAWEIARQRADAEPGPEHMRMVLAEMDDPAAYMEGAEGGKAEQQPLLAARGVHPFALCSLLVPPVGFVLMLTPLGPRGESAGAVVLIVLGCLALLFGVLGIRAIRQAP